MDTKEREIDSSEKMNYDDQEDVEQANSEFQNNKSHGENGKVIDDYTDDNELLLDNVETRCGLFGFRPECMQRFAHVGCFAPMYGFSGLVTGTLTVYVNSQVTQLERQFGFSSRQTGLIMAANDIGFLLCVLFVSYVAYKLHIPKALGNMTIVFGVSGLICCLPHFMFSSTLNLSPEARGVTSNMTQSVSAQKLRSLVIGDLCVAGGPTDDLCLVEETAESTATRQTQSEATHISLVIIFIGMMVQGFGKAPRGSYTTTYVDNNTKRTNTGFYMGVIITMAIFGPAVAFLIGGVFSRIYVTLEDTGLHPKHPKWIGAWWLGYLVFGFAALVVSTPLFFFPRRLPRKWEKEEEQMNDKKGNHQLMGLSSAMYNGSKHGPNKDLTKLQTAIWFMKDFLKTSYRLWTNPIYVLICAAACFILFMVAGKSAYTPKYLEAMFDLPTYKANYILAGNTLFASCLGTFIGGYVTKRYKMTAVTALKFILFIVFGSLAVSIAALLLRCEQPTVYGGPGQPINCEESCTCSDEAFFPICGDDGRTYYSPCFAGCPEFGEGVYSNCTCIPGGGAVPGTCPYQCSMLYPYVASLALRSLIGTLWIIPKLIILIRAVEDRDKTMALGYYSFVTSLFGWMLGPIVMGQFIDNVCDIWDNNCGTRGRCLRYANDYFRLSLHGYMSAAIGCSFICVIVANIYAWKTGCLLDIDAKGAKSKKDIKDEAKIYKGPPMSNGYDKSEKC